MSAIDATSETICGNVVPTSSSEPEKKSNFIQMAPKSSNRAYSSYKTSQFNKRNEFDDDLSFPRAQSKKGNLQVFADNIMTAETLDCPVSSPETSKVQSKTEITNTESSSIVHKLNQIKIADNSESEEETPFYTATSNVYKIPKASSKEIKTADVTTTPEVREEDSDDEFPSLNQSMSINNESIQRPPSPTPVDITTDRERIGSFQTDEESFANSTMPVVIPPSSNSSQKLEDSFIQEETKIEDNPMKQDNFSSPEVFKKAINETEIINMENETKDEILIENTNNIQQTQYDPEEPTYFDLNQSNLDIEVTGEEHYEEEIIEEPKYQTKNDNFDQYYLDDEDPELSSDDEITEAQNYQEEIQEQMYNHHEEEEVESISVPQNSNNRLVKSVSKEEIPKKTSPRVKQSYFVEEHTPEHNVSDIEEQEEIRMKTGSPSQELAQLEHKELTMFLESELTKLKDDLKKDSQIAKGVASKRLSDLPPPESLPVSSQQQPISLTLNLDAKYKYARKALLRQYFKDRSSSKEKLTDEFAKLGQPIDLNTSLKLERWDKENRELERLKASRRKYEKDLENLEKLVEIEQMEHDVELAKTKSHIVSKNKPMETKPKKGYSQLLHNKMEFMGKTLVSSSDYIKEDEPEVLVKQIYLLKTEREKYQSLVEKQKEVIKTLTEDLLTEGEFSPKEKLQIIDNIMRQAPILHNEETIKESYSSPMCDPKIQAEEDKTLSEKESKQGKTDKKKKSKNMKKKSGSEDEEPLKKKTSSKTKESNSEPNRSSTPKMKTTTNRPSSASSLTRRPSSSLSEPMNNTERRKTIIRPTSPSLTKRPSSAAGTRKVTISLDQPVSESRKTRPGSASSARCDKIVDRLYEGGIEKQVKAREWATNQKKIQEARVMQEMREKPILNRNSIEIINRKYHASETFREIDSPMESFKRNSGESPTFELRAHSSAGSLEEMRLMRQDSRRRRVKEYYIMKESMSECTFTPNLSKKTNELVSQKRSKEEGPIYKKLFEEAKEKEEQNAKLRQV